MRLFFWILILTCILAHSCVSIVKEELPSVASFPMVNAVFSSENDTCRMSVAFSANVDGKDSISGYASAKAQLYENACLIGEFLYDSHSRCHILTNFKGKTGALYQCRVQIPGYNMITSQTRLPESAKVKDVKYTPVKGLDAEGTPYASLRFTLQSKPDREQYFELCCFFPSNNNEEKRSRYPIPMYYNPGICDPVFLHEGVVAPIFSNELIKDSNYTMEYYFYNQNFDNKVYFELRTLSKEYYLYARSVFLYNKGRFPELFESASASQLYSNMENAWGIFAAYNTYTMGLIYSEFEPEEDI